MEQHTYHGVTAVLMDKVGDIQMWVDGIYSKEGTLDAAEIDEINRIHEITQEQHTLPRLFVYGIFLGEARREFYGMTDPVYYTVRGFKTVGDYIVRAVRSDSDDSLTGLLVTPDESRWEQLDALEQNYKRIKVQDNVFMYVDKSVDGKDYSTYGK